MHVRRSIRAAVATALASLATTGANVFVGRTYVLQDADLPALRIYTDAETAAIGSLGVRRALERELEVAVEACFKDLASLDDLGDTILEEVETALGAPGVDLGGAKLVNLSRVELVRDAEGEEPRAVLRMTFTAVYVTAHGAPGQAL